MQTDHMTLPDAIEAFRAVDDQWRCEVLETRYGTTKQQREKLGPPPAAWWQAVDALADAVTEGVDHEWQHAPAVLFLRAFIASADAEQPEHRLLAAIKALLEAAPRGWAPIETIEKFREEWEGEPMAHIAHALGATMKVAADVMAGQPLPEGHKRPEETERARIIACDDEDYRVACREWADHVEQRKADAAARLLHEQPAVDRCPEDWDELFSMHGMTLEQAARMKNVSLDIAALERKKFERERMRRDAERKITEAKAELERAAALSE